MTNKINFITGETYTLSELFSGDRKIIIPDLQRDYCWGDENNEKSSHEYGELVTDFVENLYELFEEHLSKNDRTSLNLGLFYGYEVPKNHIQLCDGQQRLTTLYLLLGMLNKKTGKIRHHLVSDSEFKSGGKEPYLSYAIRESSLYFMRDLVNDFFIENRESSIKDIKSENWYFNDYNFDPSIQSMLKALSVINDKLEKIPIDECEPFQDWLLNKVTFLYVDMDNRKNGEETFVVINTTGEPLSVTQNLKPLVINEDINSNYPKISSCWEEIETWFWRKRDKYHNDTAEPGFSEFLRWVSIIEQVDEDVQNEKRTSSIKKKIQLLLQGNECNFPFKKIKFESIYKYWQSLKWLSEHDNFKFAENYLSPSINYDVGNRNAIGQIDCFVLLPTLKYVYDHLEVIKNESFQLKAYRVYMFFYNLTRIDNVRKSVNSLVGDAINLIGLIKDINGGDIVSFLDVNSSAISALILSDEEKEKLTILKLSLTNLKERHDIEECFWNAQEHKVWEGEIMPMIEWSKANGRFDMNLFREYDKKNKEIFCGECDKNIDDLRLVFLSDSLSSYPLSKGKNLSLGWGWKDLHEIIKANKEWFKKFLDSFNSGNSKQEIDKRINGCDQSNKWYKFVKEPKYIAYCESKNIRIVENDLWLIKNHRATTYEKLDDFFS